MLGTLMGGVYGCMVGYDVMGGGCDANGAEQKR